MVKGLGLVLIQQVRNLNITVSFTLNMALTV